MTIYTFEPVLSAEAWGNISLVIDLMKKENVFADFPEWDIDELLYAECKEWFWNVNHMNVFNKQWQGLAIVDLKKIHKKIDDWFEDEIRIGG